jgi:hypothetical protein
MSGKSSLDGIANIRPDSVKRKRISSYDREGGNFDWNEIPSKKCITIGEETGSGSIKHIWCTIGSKSKHYLRNIIIRIYWDNEEIDKPSVEVPIGDFFGLGHAKHKNFVSFPLQMSPQSGRGFNCWWPMPFSNGFKITVENDTSKAIRLYYYIDYEIYENDIQNETEFGRFHAQWRRENPTLPKIINPKNNKRYTKRRPVKFSYGGRNTDPLNENYVILKASGKGHYVGCHLDIDNITFLPWFVNWPGEGDDMIFIDDDVDKKVPTLFGTGTEDYVNQAWAHTQHYNAPYHGTILKGGFNWWGKISYYRYHIEDPIYFNKKIIVSIEHGHDNHRKDDWSSTAYWYQLEPHDHNLFPKLLDKRERIPRSHWTHLLRKSLCFIILGILLISIFFVLLL